MNRIALGLKIRDLREKKRLTQNQLAEKINMSDNGLSNIEGGKANPHFDTIAAIADTLDVSLDYFISDDPDNDKQLYIHEITEKLKKLDLIEIKHIYQYIILWEETRHQIKSNQK